MTDQLETALRRARVTDVSTRADADERRAARAAARAGLVDVAIGTLDSPFGLLTLATTPRGLVRIAFPEEDPTDDLAARLSPRVVRAPERVDTARRQLAEYFAGRRRRFRLTLDWSLTTGFRHVVLEEARRIPPGETATYGELAMRVGNPRAARAVGTAMATNPIPIVLPCHRVVPATGGIGNYGGGVERKAALLALEGATRQR